jgi:hypothetical protein
MDRFQDGNARLTMASTRRLVSAAHARSRCLSFSIAVQRPALFLLFAHLWQPPGQLMHAICRPVGGGQAGAGAGQEGRGPTPRAHSLQKQHKTQNTKHKNKDCLCAPVSELIEVYLPASIGVHLGHRGRELAVGQHPPQRVCELTQLAWSRTPHRDRRPSRS